MVYNPVSKNLDPLYTGLPMLGGTATEGTIASCVLQSYTNQRVWLATFSITYASVPVTAFVGHGMQQGDMVIVKGTDATHVWTMGANGARDVVY